MYQIKAEHQGYMMVSIVLLFSWGKNTEIVIDIENRFFLTLNFLNTDFSFTNKDECVQFHAAIKNILHEGRMSQNLDLGLKLVIFYDKKTQKKGKNVHVLTKCLDYIQK